ncbi:MAG: TraR/DksA family transcriptional regulator [Phycisphaerae bacterium]
MTDKELDAFKELLLEKRAELAGNVNRLASEALNSKGSGQGDHSVMPIHMADLGSDNWEQEFTLGLLENEEALVREIDEALARIETRTYGMCLATHKRISKARLRAKPWAKFCIEYARAREEGRVS